MTNCHVINAHTMQCSYNAISSAIVAWLVFVMLLYS